MIFSYNWLQSFFKQKLPAPEKLAEVLTLHLAEVEGVKKEGGDFVLDIDIRPNRASDCLCHVGLAREISAILNFKTGVEKIRLGEDKNLKTRDLVSLEVKSKSACLRYTARVINEVKVFPSPKWLQERLTACGLRPINNVVDATNYVMLEMGQPLHAFDAGKISDKKIIVRSAKEGEKIATLDNENYKLEDGILVITDSQKPLAIAGIKGGKLAEIGRQTKTIVLESANFSSKTVRRTSRMIDLKTDASLRFEHGLDPNLAEPALNRAALLIQQIAGGKLASGLIDFYPVKVLPKKIKLDLAYAKSLLGIEIAESKAKSILKSLGFTIKSSGLVEAPTRRRDISCQEDLVEEIGRIYGYEKIPSVFPRATLAPPERNLDIFWLDRAKDVLKEVGFNEVYNYSFISEKSQEIVELENPLSSDYRYLRPSLIPGLLKNIEKNHKNFKEIKIFESGKVFTPKLEELRLAGAMTGDSFYEAKGVVDLLLNEMGIKACRYEEHPGGAEIKVGQETVGFLGMTNSTTYFDLFFDRLTRLSSEEREYQPPSRFPSADRDIAVLVPKTVKVAQVLEKIYKGGGSLASRVDLFDIYEGKELPEGKKNLAFHIIYQAEDRTLSSKEIDDVQNKIIKTLEVDPEWRVRR